MSDIFAPMRSIRGRPMLCAAIFSVTLLAVVASADDYPPGDVVPLQQLFAEIHAEFPGRILEVELDDDDGDKWIYEVKVLTPQGHVLKLEYDAVSLELLEVKGRREFSSD